MTSAYQQSSTAHFAQNFIAHFNKEDVKWCQQLTVQQAGFHGTNHMTTIVTPQANNTSPSNTSIMNCEGITLYYCWTHGLSRNHSHTSKTYKSPAKGHQKEATFRNMMGSCCTLMRPCNQPCNTSNNITDANTQANKWWSGDPKSKGNSSKHGNPITTDSTISSISQLLGAPTTITSTNFIKACADTRATGHFFTTTLPISNIHPTMHWIAIHNLNGTIMHSTHEAKLDLPQLPLLARWVHIVPALKSQLLLSIAQLCDANCKATFMCTQVRIHHNGTCILTREHDPIEWIMM